MGCCPRVSCETPPGSCPGQRSAAPTWHPRLAAGITGPPFPSPAVQLSFRAIAPSAGTFHSQHALAAGHVPLPRSCWGTFLQASHNALMGGGVTLVYNNGACKNDGFLR